MKCEKPGIRCDKIITGMKVKQGWAVIKVIKTFSQKILILAFRPNVFRRIKQVTFPGSFCPFHRHSQLCSFTVIREKTLMSCCAQDIRKVYFFWSVALCLFFLAFIFHMQQSHHFISLSKCNSLWDFIHQSLSCHIYLTIRFYKNMMEMSSSLSYFTEQSVHFMLGWQNTFFFLLLVFSVWNKLGK